MSLNLAGTTTKVSKLPQLDLRTRASIIPIMPRIQEKIKRIFGVVLTINTVCSGSIAPSQNFDTTHRVKKSSNLGCNSILHKFSNFWQGLSKFSKVSAPTFEAIGGGL
ncbi:hypothetical protein [Microcoleus vaginatus]|uniref:hypothetical protein n=1 Tax=Microcoleus vaginatus TaxID=119532 RepID=UPI00168933DB|nr:hypothetical protein [Microcoleus sp. FACHB-84]MBD2008008.1 hypothetical protein [Microcoleus sp. FACHB-45]